MNTNTGGADCRTQRDQLLAYYMEGHRSISRASALSKLGIANLPEIVRQLRVRGIPIRSEQTEKVGRNGRKVKFTKYIYEAEA